MLKSRKVWAAIIGLIVILVNAYINQEQIDPDTITNAVMGIVAALMASIAVEDGMKAKAEVAPTTTIETPAPNVTVTTADDTGTPLHVRRTL
jgi:hypothetical protein